jgi:predicted permease
MYRVLRFVRRLLTVVRPHRRDEDLVREIAAHATLLEDEYRRRGLSPEEAHRQARAALGGVERIKELHRSARSFPMLDDAVRDLRYAVRVLRRTPIFTATAMLSLAIAIGASTTVFTAVNALLIRTAPGVADPDRLVDISRMSGPIGVEAISWNQYIDIRDRATRVQDMFTYAVNLTPMSWVDRSGDPARAVFADLVSPNFFAALGVTPAAGRMFTETDVRSVVVISYRFWRDRLEGNPSVIGSAMRLGDGTFTVVGVTRPEFHGNTVLAPDLWMTTDGTRPLNIGLVGARLRPGVTLAEARAEMEGIGRRLSTDLMFRRESGLFAKLRVDRSSPIPYGVRVIVAGFLGVLMVIVLMVLVVACANVAGLLLARGAGRARETAVRVALGVGRARLVRQLLTETIVLFAAGGIGGLVMSRAMAAVILRLLPSLPLPADPSLLVDGRVIVFALALSLTAAISFGLAPAIYTARVDVLSMLKAQEQGSASAVRVRRAFVIAQVALSIVLVVVGGLLTRALRRSAIVDGGFDSHGVDVVSIDLATAGYTSTTGRIFIADLERRLRLQPDIQTMAIASETPTSGAMGFQVSVPGVVPPDGRSLFEVLGNTVTRGYFDTLGISVLSGRDFTDIDTASAPHVVIVTAKTVRRFWPSRPASEAVGRQLLLQPNLIDRRNPNPLQSLIPMTIVGVVADGGSGTTSRPYIYLPIQQQYASAIKILARARGDRHAISGVREQLRAMDRRLPVVTAGALEDEAGPATIQLRISATIAGSLGVVGLLLAAIGIYGVTSYMVARRTREIGIRVALGADRAAVVRMAMSEGALLLAIGALAGLMLAAGAARVLRGLQLGIVAADPVPFTSALLISAVVGLAASYMPVRRALAIDPSRALRNE